MTGSRRPLLLCHFLKLFVSDPRQSEPARRASSWGKR
nr:MAG TPA: hypothetical protein [Caudoviricetes sp.]